MDYEKFLKPGERLDDLQRNGYFIIQSPEKFCFGCDAVLLSSFAFSEKHEVVLDIGTGTGIIPILMKAKTKSEKFYGLEIQEESVEMAKRSVKLNKLEDSIEIVCGDVKNLSEIFGRGKIDVITTNPPYISKGGGILNSNSPKAIARHEILCDLEDIISESSAVLKTNGRFYMIHRPNRLGEIFFLMGKYNIIPKKMRMIHPKIDREPTMVLIEGIKNANKMMKIMPPLIMYDENGNITPEVAGFGEDSGN